jgi:hypothetical protein
MRDTAIVGERPTPGIFFIVPTGKGRDLRAAHQRDYRGDILEPVVKPWLEKDQNVTLAGIVHVSSGGDDWRNALDAAAIAPAVPVSGAARPASRPAMEVPPAALSRPSAPALPPPSQARPAAPPPASPPPAAAPPPPPSSHGGSGDVPILVPPQ